MCKLLSDKWESWASYEAYKIKPMYWMSHIIAEFLMMIKKTKWKKVTILLFN